MRARLASASAALPLATDTSSLNVMARLGVGAWYRAGERLSLGAMVELDPILGDFGYTGGPSRRTLAVLAGAMLPL